METLSFSSNESANNSKINFSLNGVRYNFINSSEVSKILRELTECFSKDDSFISKTHKFCLPPILDKESNSSNILLNSNNIAKNDSSSSELSISTLTTSMDSQNSEGNCDSKNHVCQTCGKSFPKRDFLQKHKIVHEAPKHRCVICDKCFMREDKLKRHFLSIHSKHRPHVCQTCSKAFARKDKLKDHLKHHVTAGDNFRCGECRISFVQKSDLNRHSRLVHGGRKIETPKATRSKSSNKSTSFSKAQPASSQNTSSIKEELNTQTIETVTEVSTNVPTQETITSISVSNSTPLSVAINSNCNNSTALYTPIMMLSTSSVNPFASTPHTTGLLVTPALSLFPNLPLKMPQTSPSSNISPPITTNNSTSTTLNNHSVSISSPNSTSSNTAGGSLTSNFTAGYMNYRFPSCQLSNSTQQIAIPANNIKKETAIINPVQSSFYPHLHAAVISPFQSPTSSMIPVFPHYLSASATTQQPNNNNTIQQPSAQQKQVTSTTNTNFSQQFYSQHTVSTTSANNTNQIGLTYNTQQQQQQPHYIATSHNVASTNGTPTANINYNSLTTSIQQQLVNNNNKTNSIYQTITGQQPNKSEAYTIATNIYTQPHPFLQHPTSTTTLSSIVDNNNIPNTTVVTTPTKSTIKLEQNTAIINTYPYLPF